MRLAFLHGWGFSSKVFNSLDGLKIDIASHGEAYNINYSSFEEEALRIKAILEKENINILIGWSLGASLAVIASNFINLKKLILISYSPFFKKAWPEKNIRAFFIKLQKDFENSLYEFRRMSYPYKFEDVLNKESSLKLLKDYINISTTKYLSKLNTNITIFQGKNDKVIPYKQAFLARYINPNIKIILHEGGHFTTKLKELLQKELS